jgi:hypothetical protein
MSPVLTRHAPEPVRHLRGVAVPIAVVVCFAALFVGVLRLVEPPATVDAVTLENRTGFDLEIGVTDGSRTSELPLAPVDPGTTTRVEDVLDQGSDWVFRVTRAGEAVGTLERSRDRLRADGWRLVVPVAWDDRIATAEPTSAVPG